MRGMLRCGGQGTARLRVAWPAEAVKARLGSVGLGLAVKARQGLARQGSAGLGGQP